MKKMRVIIISLTWLIVFQSALQAQEDLLQLLDEQAEETTTYARTTFETSRIINGHSCETHGKKTLQFLIGHRFGRLNSGFKELFGLDNATMRIGLEYGIFDGLDIGLGRSSFEKTYDGFVKYKLLKQSTGKKTMPLTMTLLVSAEIKTNDWPEPERTNYFTSRMYYTFQMMVARKFNKYFSLQLAPMLVHRNLVAMTADRNDVFVLGAGGRVKVTRSLSINAEYYWIPAGQVESELYGEKVHDSFSVGIDLETGGHVFQLHFTNSRGMINRVFSTETTGAWGNGDIHFGFNISRVFSLGRKKEKK